MLLFVADIYLVPGYSLFFVLRRPEGEARKP